MNPDVEVDQAERAVRRGAIVSGRACCPLHPEATNREARRRADRACPCRGGCCGWHLTPAQKAEAEQQIMESFARAIDAGSEAAE